MPDDAAKPDEKPRKVRSRKPTYRARFDAWVAQHAPERIGSGEVEQLLAALSPIKPHTLHRLLREAGCPLDPLVEGVRQDTLDHLERTLAALAAAYSLSPAPARNAVLTARQHAEWALRRHPDDAARQEAMLWLRTWLENPAVFSVWCRLRGESRGLAQSTLAIISR